MAHSTEHFNATRDYLAVHGRRARQRGALARLESDKAGLAEAGQTDARIEREIETLRQRIGN